MMELKVYFVNSYRIKKAKFTWALEFSNLCANFSVRLNKVHINRYLIAMYSTLEIEFTSSISCEFTENVRMAEIFSPFFSLLQSFVFEIWTRCVWKKAAMVSTLICEAYFSFIYQIGFSLGLSFFYWNNPIRFNSKERERERELVMSFDEWFNLCWLQTKWNGKCD